MFHSKNLNRYNKKTKKEEKTRRIRSKKLTLKLFVHVPVKLKQKKNHINKID